MIRLALTLALCPLTALAQAQCEVPQNGTWQAEFSQTMTVAGLGGMGGPQTFELVSSGCGATVETNGFGAPETGVIKQHVGTFPAYSFATVYQGYAFSLQTTFSDATHFNSVWNMAGFAAATATAQLMSPSPAGLHRDARCDCPPFITGLQARIAANDAQIAALRALPSGRPEGLRDGVEWDGAALARYLELLGGAAGAFWDDEALADVGAEAGMDLFPDDPMTADQTDGSVGFVEGIDCNTCRIIEVPEVAACGGDVLGDAAAARREDMALRCEEASAATTLAAPDAGEGPVFCALQRDPAFLIDMKVAALEAETRAIRERYQTLCQSPL